MAKIKFLANMINMHRLTIDRVPEDIREAVQALLI